MASRSLRLSVELHDSHDLRARIFAQMMKQHLTFAEAIASPGLLHHGAPAT